MQLTGDRLLLTAKGKGALAAEIACLDRIRQEIVAELEAAPAECAASTEGSSRCRHELEALDKELGRLRRVLVEGMLVADNSPLVAVGSEVTVTSDEDEQTFTIVGPAEANLQLGCISYESPLALAILGHRVGEEVEIDADEGRSCRLQIKSITRVLQQSLG